MNTLTTINKILKDIETLTDDERKALLKELKDKYEKLPQNAFVASKAYDFWRDEEDLYDE